MPPLWTCGRAEADLRELMGVSEDYHVLFLQGGATGQFAGVPLNLTQSDDTIDFIDTGSWSKKPSKKRANTARSMLPPAAATAITTTFRSRRSGS
ncbi:MAG: hypothetical protein CM15mP120_12950 [Pseudomonadota bacterium]|nr:MAG: hypothetical protein CM15mP120_12950 [Pseudomonadota bacterium]